MNSLFNGPGVFVGPSSMRLECDWVEGVPQVSVPALSLFPGEFVPPTCAVADPEAAVGEPIVQVTSPPAQSPPLRSPPGEPRSPTRDEEIDSGLLQGPSAEQLGLKRRSVSFAEADALEQVMPILSFAAPTAMLELNEEAGLVAGAGDLAVPSPPAAFDARPAEGFTVSVLALDQSSCLYESTRTQI